MAKKKTLTCDLCGKPGYSGPGTRPQGEYRCRGCLKVEPRPVRHHTPPNVCKQCWCTFRAHSRKQQFCSVACYGLSIRINESKVADPYYKRAMRASGLTEKARWALLAKWKRQERHCTYCDAPCQAVDHVIPLQRGGTNYEGNLTPCCTACNSRKSHATIMEWRMGKKPARTYSPRAPREPKPAKVPELRLVLDVACCICGQVFAPKTRRSMTCSASCLDEKHARKARDAYRAAHGMPVDPAQPTKPTRRVA